MHPGKRVHRQHRARRGRGPGNAPRRVDRCGEGTRVTTTDDVRGWAMALPEVEETSHFRFHVPVWKVRGKTFLGMDRDETTAVFCVSEQEADDEAEASPATCAAVRRQDARRSFLGLQVELRGLSGERLRDLTERAWRQQAPRRLAAEHDQGQPGTTGAGSGG